MKSPTLNWYRFLQPLPFIEETKQFLSVVEDGLSHTGNLQYRKTYQLLHPNLGAKTRKDTVPHRDSPVILTTPAESDKSSSVQRSD